MDLEKLPKRTTLEMRKRLIGYGLYGLEATIMVLFVPDETNDINVFYSQAIV